MPVRKGAGKADRVSGLLRRMNSDILAAKVIARGIPAENIRKYDEEG